MYRIYVMNTLKMKNFEKMIKSLNKIKSIDQICYLLFIIAHNLDHLLKPEFIQKNIQILANFTYYFSKSKILK